MVELCYNRQKNTIKRACAREPRPIPIPHLRVEYRNPRGSNSAHRESVDRENAKKMFTEARMKETTEFKDKKSKVKGGCLDVFDWPPPV